MITVEEALELVFANLPARKSESVYFEDALGRVLAEDLAATINIPPFDRSAMDGYAVRAADVENAPVELEVVGESRAGGGDPGALQPGQAIAIMTGARIPEGADAVQIVEQAERVYSSWSVTILQAVKAGENIARIGFEAAEGEIVLREGRVIGPAEIAVLATFGYSRINVWKVPRVAVLATGDELVEVNETPRMDQIRNSNAYSISAQLRVLGLAPEYLGIARDDREELRLKMLEGLERDVLILTGGVSMGEYDFVPEVFKQLGLEILFSKISMKPGKPTVFARKGEKIIFGLPGNPVSTFVAFENFVRPALGRLSGLRRPELCRIRGELLREVRQSPGRQAYLPAWVFWEDTGWKIDPFPWKGSADIIGFSGANATVIIPADCSLLEKGALAEAVLLPDFFDRQRT